MHAAMTGNGKNLEAGNLLEEQYSLFFPIGDPCGVQLVSSFHRRLEKEKQRRQVVERFWGHGNKKAAGSCTFHS